MAAQFLALAMQVQSIQRENEFLKRENEALKADLQRMATFVGATAQHHRESDAPVVGAVPSDVDAAQILAGMIIVPEYSDVEDFAVPRMKRFKYADNAPQEIRDRVYRYNHLEKDAVAFCKCCTRTVSSKKWHVREHNGEWITQCNSCTTKSYAKV